jgi:hypothetical protein
MPTLELNKGAAESSIAVHGPDRVFSKEFLVDTGVMNYADLISRNHAFAHGLLVEEELQKMNEVILPIIGGNVFKVSGLVQVCNVREEQPPQQRVDAICPVVVDVDAQLKYISVRRMQGCAAGDQAPYLAFTFSAADTGSVPSEFGIPILSHFRTKVVANIPTTMPHVTREA